MDERTPIIESASWRIATELCRRLPILSISQHHPGGGQADCLAIIHPELGNLGELNRKGTFHTYARLDGLPVRDEIWPIWDELLAQSSAELVDAISGKFGLAVPTKLPPTRPHVLSYRVIAALLTLHTFSRSQWLCRNALLDSSGFMIEPLESAIEKFPIPNHLIRGGAGEYSPSVATDFWIVYRDGDPVLCIRVTGEAWSTDGTAWNLTKVYQESNSVLHLVSMLLGKEADV